MLTANSFSESDSSATLLLVSNGATVFSVVADAASITSADDVGWMVSDMLNPSLAVNRLCFCCCCIDLYASCWPNPLTNRTFRELTWLHLSWRALLAKPLLLIEFKTIDKQHITAAAQGQLGCCTRHVA